MVKTKRNGVGRIEVISPTPKERALILLKNALSETERPIRDFTDNEIIILASSLGVMKNTIQGDFGELLRAITIFGNLSDEQRHEFYLLEKRFDKVAEKLL